MFILYGANHRGPQQLEDGVMFAILQQIHGVPCHWVIHRDHKVQHVLLFRLEVNTIIRTELGHSFRFKCVSSE